MRQLSAERIHHHDERRSNYNRKRHRRRTGRARCAGEGPLEEGGHPEEGRAQRPESRQGRQSQGLPKKAKAGTKAKPAPAKEVSTPRAESKGAKILELIGRSKGATLAEIVKATDLKHSIRGFLSTAAKKHGLKIESTKTEAGDRVYLSQEVGMFEPPPARVAAFSYLARGGGRIAARFLNTS
jgi:hypothetical protein